MGSRTQCSHWHSVIGEFSLLPAVTDGPQWISISRLTRHCRQRETGGASLGFVRRLALLLSSKAPPGAAVLCSVLAVFNRATRAGVVAAPRSVAGQPHSEAPNPDHTGAGDQGAMPSSHRWCQCSRPRRNHRAPKLGTSPRCVSSVTTRVRPSASGCRSHR